MTSLTCMYSSILEGQQEKLKNINNLIEHSDCFAFLKQCLFKMSKASNASVQNQSEIACLSDAFLTTRSL